MAIDLVKKYTELKRKADDATQNAARAEGALNQIIKQLKSDFGCNSFKEAKEKLASLEKEKNDSYAAFEKALTEFEEKWQASL